MLLVSTDQAARCTCTGRAWLPDGSARATARPIAAQAAPALASQRRLVESVGGTYHQVVGDDIPEALLAFARAENATQLVLGASRRSWLMAMLTGPGIGSRTIRESGDIDVHIVTHGHMGRGRGLPRQHWRTRWPMRLEFECAKCR